MNAKQYFDNYLYNLPEFNWKMHDTFKDLNSFNFNLNRCMDYIRMHYSSYNKLINELSIIINGNNNVDALAKRKLDEYRNSLVNCVYLCFDLMKTDPLFKHSI